ncbi:MAG TPA: GntR family transcriptional regulator [Capsulimonadaceae bacterium]|nr:GntR family transcriptional regulator [Capsulimonadaceae bacterium]
MLIKEPIYQQLNEVLRQTIRAGQYRAHDRFLTEREISEKYGVSRATANKALSSLVAEGLVEFRKGIGTFVRSSALDYDLRSLVSFTDQAKAAGKTPSTVVVAFQAMTAESASSEVREKLGVSEDEELYSMKRVRLADSVPVIYERRHLVARHCPGLTEKLAQGSLYALWTDRYKLAIAGAEEIIRAVILTDEETRHLAVERGAAGLLVTSVGYLKGENPLWYEQTVYRSDAYEFRNRLGPIRTAGPATGALI